LLERLLGLLYPIIPQVTSFIGEAKGIDLLKSEWPKIKNDGEGNIYLVDSIIRFNSHVWKEKKEEGISLRDGIEGIEIPKELVDFEKDLKACHGI
jgi:valyl-tRNA synthetase